MTPSDQIKALAQLDGWTYVPGMGMERDMRLVSSSDTRFSYLTDYNSIIPLIQKQTPEVIAAMSDALVSFAMNCAVSECCRICTIKGTLRLTPAQLSEALLRATGLWQDDEKGQP